LTILIGIKQITVYVISVMEIIETTRLTALSVQIFREFVSGQIIKDIGLVFI
jgi:hypothetical protein